MGHPLQIKAMFELRQILAEEDWERVKLVIVGGCRGQDDWKLVQDLKDLTKYLSVENNVEFHPNLPFSDLLAEFSKSTIGIHTMWNEHFGIGIVEMMAAGLLTMSEEAREGVRSRAAASSDMFSSSQFEGGWVR